MNLLKFGAKMFSKNSFWLLLAGGAALALLSDRRHLRSSAVKVTKKALIAKDEVRNAAAKVSAKASDFIEEARQKRGTSSCRGGATREKGHRIAVATTAKILTFKEAAQAEFKSIVDEAKRRRAIR
ncbi:hypothetical protein [Pelosinus propionicus]|uniref:Uncharacterized protein n=1 Tax=Pelosinus propionicus DSM 13327 TaxID=1123291 RepID=A0A1I4MI70_9FIRM|nr:hypothetical protein [Pelosinus propionicus]SFM02737.1 hypothetical protein SAMN04490355_103412 [Pelosinus propionicus DSM 13327]